MRFAHAPLVLFLCAFVSLTGCTRSPPANAATIQSERAAEVEPQHFGRIEPMRAATIKSQSGGPTSATLLVCSPEGEVQFGVVPHGGRKDGVFSLTNPTAAAIEVAEIKISCECLKITLPSRTIEPGETVWGTIVLDLAPEPESTGKLGIEVEGFAEGGETAFAFTVLVEIPESEPIAGND